MRNDHFLRNQKEPEVEPPRDGVFTAVIMGLLVGTALFFGVLAWIG